MAGRPRRGGGEGTKEAHLEVIGEPMIADAVLDRIVHNAYRIDLKGESQRKRNKLPPPDGGNDK